VSYTVDTLEDIIARYQPAGKPALIIGDDLAEEFPKWHESKKILQLADIVIIRRVNAASSKISFPHVTIQNEVMNVSSREIRQKINEDCNSVARSSVTNWRSLLPSGARMIIEDKRLYGYKTQHEAGKNCTQAVIQKVEAHARETLSMERFLHSRNTAVHASDLCRRFGLDAAAGFLAGIAHDLAKQTENKHLIKLVKNSGYHITSLEKKRPNLLHGKAAAVLLRERFSIHNKEVLEAVAFHTSGSEYMGPLAKIVYIADKTESSRNIDSALRKICSGDPSLGTGEADLNNILFAVIERMINKLKAKDLDLSDDTLKLLERIKGIKN
ncbi:MAG: bis(5'-nucleosyl)-tetraphosphatase (symmetrical) YqeK, partial [Treponema sp.]|nr:bis(5'-nucleosyl)-tetraphosphatase (symmetrical) YqeK [Treponema sp.]